jgi:hypothetical protein
MYIAKSTRVKKRSEVERTYMTTSHSYRSPFFITAQTLVLYTLRPACKLCHIEIMVCVVPWLNEVGKLEN